MTAGTPSRAAMRSARTRQRRAGLLSTAGTGGSIASARGDVGLGAGRRGQVEPAIAGAGRDRGRRVAQEDHRQHPASVVSAAISASCCTAPSPSPV